MVLKNRNPEGCPAATLVVRDRIGRDVLEAVDRDHEIPDNRAVSIERRGAFRAVAVAQSSLLETVGRKLQPYLRAPAVYLALADNEAFVGSIVDFLLESDKEPGAPAPPEPPSGPSTGAPTP